MVEKVNWLSYKFGIYEKSTDWNAVGGIYIFAGLNSDNYWVPYYVGKTGNFSTRIPFHEKWDEAEQLGATHVHALAESQGATRQEVEDRLIEEFDPPLNKQ